MRWSGHRIRFSPTLLLLALLLLVPPDTAVQVAQAQAPEVTLEVQPQSVEIGADETARVNVILRNNSEETLDDLSLTTLANAAVSVLIPETGETAVLPGSTAIWQLAIRQPSAGPESAKIVVTAQYTWSTGGDGSSTPRGTAVAEFDVTAPAVTDVSEVAALEARSAITALNEQRPGVVYLAVSNRADVPIRITAVNPAPLDFVTFTVAESPPLPTTIQPNNAIVIPVKVTAVEAVQPGKQLLLFTVEAAWQQAGRPQTGTLVASHEVEVGVFGESAILTLLGIPAFFLLPGFLLLITFRILWTLSGKGAGAAILDLKNKPGEFLVLSITISLVAAIVYPRVTGRSYLEAYGLNDILTVWFASIVLGLLLFVVVWSGQWGWGKYQAQRLKARTLLSGDSPMTVLRKLQAQGRTLKCDQAWIAAGEGEYRVCLLQSRGSTSEKLWVAPQICVANSAVLTPDVRAGLGAAIASGNIAEVLALGSSIQLLWKQREEQEVLWPVGVSIPLQIETTAVQEYIDSSNAAGLLLGQC